jgi:hypothetical protein
VTQCRDAEIPVTVQVDVASRVGHGLDLAGAEDARPGVVLPHGPIDSAAGGAVEGVRPDPRPTAHTFTLITEWTAAKSTGASATADLQPVGGIVIPPTPTPTPSSASGCSASDFTGFVPGRIALIPLAEGVARQTMTHDSSAGARVTPVLP